MAFDPVDLALIRKLGSAALPFGETTTVKEVLAECQPEFDAEMGAFALTPVPNVEVGKEYIINWNGVEYRCTAFIAGEDAASTSVVLGNASLDGGEDTGEPFAIIVLYVNDGENVSMAAPVDGSTTLTISIRQEVTTVTPIPLDLMPKSHQFGEIETYILPETELTLMENEDMMVGMPTLSSALQKNQNYTVTVDGVEYNCASVFIEEMNTCILGNMMVAGGEDTGEPFAILDTGAQTMFVSLTGASSSTVSIRGIADVPISGRYAPEPVFVDLVALGMEPLDGTNSYHQSIPVDRELFTKAFKNGFIKIRVAVTFSGRTNLALESIGLNNTSGTFEFIAPVKAYNGDFVVETTLFDSAIFMKVQTDGILCATMFKYALYNKGASEIMSGK